MSRQELVDAYIEGSLSRRAFVRRLMAAGVSAGAAAGYAQMLAPTAKAAPRAHRHKRNPGDDLYPRIVVEVLTKGIKNVRHHNRVKVRVTANATLDTHVSLFLDKGGHLIPLGFMPADPTSARLVQAGVPKTMTIPMNQDASALSGLQKAKILVEVFYYGSTAGQGKATLK